MKFLLISAILALTQLQLSIGFPTTPQRLRNPEEGDAFQGDIEMTDEEIANMFSKNGYNEIYKKKRWPNNTIPYELDSEHTEASKNRIFEAIKMITDKTCFRFVEHSDEKDYVFVKANTGKCQSPLGRKGIGKQILSMDDTCQTGSIAHEFLHAMGFFHEQCRSDRDTYVRINFENIEDGKSDDFKLYGPDMITDFGTPYDYGSIMHYAKDDFGKVDQNGNRAETITVLQPTDIVIGQRVGLSDMDALRVNKMYNCPT